MTDPVEDQERALQDLFERTAIPPSESLTHRLQAHAAEVAEEGVRQRWLTSRIVWPLAVAAAAAAAYLVVAPSKDPPVSVTPAPAPTLRPAPPPTVPPAPAPEESSDEAEEVEAFAALSDPSLTDPFDLGPLMDEGVNEGPSNGM